MLKCAIKTKGANVCHYCKKAVSWEKTTGGKRTKREPIKKKKRKKKKKKKKRC